MDIAPYTLYPQVPAKLYPWALLVLWQMLMPGASFLGHLCGVAVRGHMFDHLEAF